MNKEERKTEELSKIEKKVLKKFKTNTIVEIDDLANFLDMGPANVSKVIKELYKKGYNFDLKERFAGLKRDLELTEKPLDISTSDFFGRRVRFGAIADTHLGSKYERLDIMNAIYDIYKKEGIKKVYLGGNFVDGEFYFNKYETYTHGFDEMIDNFIKKFPQREGIKTYFISGDDHEGWWMQREGLDAGRITEDRARLAGRKDLVYLGYQERDINLKTKQGKATMRLMHAGGGTAYADSYSTQKMVESFGEGEKPHILLVGHYHKSIYHTPRGIHTLQLGTTQGQTRFMRKKKIRAHLGGWIVELNQSPTGEINRFKPEWLHFWDESFYRRKTK